MHDAWAITTASSPCICSDVRVEGSNRLPPGWVAAFDLRMPSTAAARLSAGTLPDMHSHIFCDPVTMYSFMKASCACTEPRRLAATAPTTRKDSTRIKPLPENG